MSETTLTAAHPARLALHAVDAGLAGLAEANLWSLSDAEVLDLRIAAEATLARLHGAVLALTREVDGRGAAGAVGAPSTAAWLRGRLRIHPAAAKAEVALAADLDGPMPEVRDALAGGLISRDSAAAVAAGIRGLPRSLDQATTARAQTYLVEQATQFDPAALHRVGRHLALALDPERGAALEREEGRQADRQELTLGHDPDGTRPLRGRFGPEDGALLDTVLQALSAPRPAADGSPDPRTPAQRRAEGFLDLVGALVTSGDDLPESGGQPVTLTVTTTAGYLRAGPAATLDDGTPLSPEATRRLGCDGWLVAAIVDADHAVLDIGRTSRIVPRPLRRALTLRDRGCAFPGCGRPARWTHAHHIQHWAHGGHTKLDNLVLLCGHHHRVVHHEGWDVDIGTDGHPRFHPPPWIDPHRTPRPCWRPPDLETRRLTVSRTAHRPGSPGRSS